DKTAVPSKAESMEIAPAAPLAREIANKPAEEPHLTDRPVVPFKAEPIAPAASLPREIAEKPAEESEAKDKPRLPFKMGSIEFAPLVRVARETAEKRAEDSQITGEWAQLPKVHAPKIEPAGVAMSPMDAPAKAV